MGVEGVKSGKDGPKRQHHNLQLQVDQENAIEKQVFESRFGVKEDRELRVHQQHRPLQGDKDVQLLKTRVGPRQTLEKRGP